MNNTQYDVRTISSGTMATIHQQATGQAVRDYTTLDRLQWDFVAWVDLHPDFKNWQEAWKAYQREVKQ